MTDTALAAATAKFTDPDRTADGARRARVRLDRLRTLWINTGTLCNIACRNCYIESSPTNDAFAYISRAEAARFDEIAQDGWPVTEIGFTGGEPFMNPDMIGMIDDALKRGFSVLVLTNAMQPMLRPGVAECLLELRDAYRDEIAGDGTARHRLRIRVSLDHYTKTFHDDERGDGSFDKTVDGLDWLAAHGFAIAIAGRMRWGESEADARAGSAALIERHGWPLNAADTDCLVLFPEMDARTDVPEITEDCWSILGVSPRDVMCASSRMVVKRRGASAPAVLPCTLLTQDIAFEMGATLAESARANGVMFDDGAVKLCHPHCAKFCVLGGGTCAATTAE